METYCQHPNGREATATSHPFTSLDCEQKGILSTKERGGRGDKKKGFLKNTVPDR